MGKEQQQQWEQIEFIIEFFTLFRFIVGELRELGIQIRFEFQFVVISIFERLWEFGEWIESKHQFAGISIERWWIWKFSRQIIIFRLHFG